MSLHLWKISLKDFCSLSSGKWWLREQFHISTLSFILILLYTRLLFLITNNLLLNAGKVTLKLVILNNNPFEAFWPIIMLTLWIRKYDIFTSMLIDLNFLLNRCCIESCLPKIIASTFHKFVLWPSKNH